jgi:hypothetical protein
MRRVATVLAVYVALVSVVFASLSRARWGSVVPAMLREDYVYRADLAEAFIDHPEPADVVWLGDSTVMSTPARIGYAALLNGQLERAGHGTRVFATRGLDAYGYYALMGPALVRRAKLVVLTANLRLFKPTGLGLRFDSLFGWVPAGELPRLATLPYGVRGMTFPAALLARIVRSPTSFEWLMFLDGLRREAEGSTWWEPFGPRLAKPAGQRSLTRQNEQFRAEYARPLSSRQPIVVLLGAAVEMATRHGAKVLVVVSPVPVDALEVRGEYDAATLARSVEILDREVSSRGGALLDLSRALSRSDFRDESGHFSYVGTQKMVGLIIGPIADALGDTTLAPKSLRAPPPRSH